jgi:hypothetical protein
MQLYATGGDRALIAGVRTLASPLVFAVLPLGILHWRRIGWYGRVAVVLAILASADFSILRGTDKEFADLFMVGGASAFVAYGRDTTLGVRSLDLVRRYWLLAIVGVLFVYVAQGLSIDRKGERNGGFANQTSLCANDSSVCVDLDNPWIAWLPLPQRFGTTSFVLSVSSGYYGLELALEKPFQSSFGLGHSPAAISVYEALSGDQGPHLRTYTYRNGADGWPEDYYWSTLMAWLANDVGFAGTLPLLAGIAYLWGMWWREAAAGMSDPAAILFCLATMMMFYLPANNEVLASYEGYAVLGVWIAIWLVHRRRSAISAIETG